MLRKLDNLVFWGIDNPLLLFSISLIESEIKLSNISLAGFADITSASLCPAFCSCPNRSRAVAVLFFTLSSKF